MTLPVTLREALPTDQAVIEAVLAVCGLRSEGVLTSDSRYWVAELDTGSVIGVVGLEFSTTAALLRSAGVVPTWRGHGLGTALLQRALIEAGLAGRSIVYLFSTDAGAYWSRQGFVEVPVAEVVAALPIAFQVLHYAELGWLPTEIAWRKDIG
jgi:N-acetylglutamate synthase-like GNAT family acetyltransferase